MVRRCPSQLLATVLLVVAVSACSSATTAETSAPTATSPITTTQAVTSTAVVTTSARPTTSAEPTTTLLAVEGPDPSPRIVAFYYPWYGTPDFDGRWVHWNQAGAHPPAD